MFPIHIHISPRMKVEGLGNGRVKGWRDCRKWHDKTRVTRTTCWLSLLQNCVFRLSFVDHTDERSENGKESYWHNPEEYLHHDVKQYGRSIPLSKGTKSSISWQFSSGEKLLQDLPKSSISRRLKD